MSTSAEFKTGQRINGRYEVLSVLGIGCMGTVYKVSDTQLGGAYAALKLLSPDFGVRPEELVRFRREVLLLRKVVHPNVVSVFDFGTTEAHRHYYSMEYVEGQSLYEMLYNNYDVMLKADELTSLLLDISAGLAAIHSVGVVHCDLKPENIMISPEGRIKLTDFGLSSDLQSSRYGHAPGLAVGTPFYMSPEQFRGDTLDPRADIYALGLIAYEMAVRKKAFYHTDYFELAELHFHKTIPDVADARKDLPRWYAEFISKCTQKTRECRFADTEELQTFLRKQVSHRKEFKRKRAGRKTTFFDSRSFRQAQDSRVLQPPAPDTEVRMQQASGLHSIADAHYLLGSEYLAKAKLAAAKQHLEIASQLDPYNSDALFARAALAEQSEQLEEAVQLYKRILKRDSHAEAAYLALGMLYYRLDKSQEALLHLGTFVGMAREHEEYHEDCAEVENLLKELEQRWHSR